MASGTNSIPTNSWDFCCIIWTYICRSSERRPKTRVLAGDRTDEGVGCTPEYCVPGWLLHTAGVQVPGNRVRSVW